MKQYPNNLHSASLKKKKKNIYYESCTNTTPNLENKATYQFGK